MLHTRLKSGDYVAVFVRPADFDYEEFERTQFLKIQDQFSKGSAFISDGTAGDVTQGHLKMFLVNDPQLDGNLRFLDVAVRIVNKPAA